MKYIHLLITFIIFLVFSCTNSSKNQIENEVSLWPEIEPFQSNYLKVALHHFWENL